MRLLLEKPQSRQSWRTQELECGNAVWVGLARLIGLRRKHVSEGGGASGRRIQVQTPTLVFSMFSWSEEP
jgi:hypothetical protein